MRKTAIKQQSDSPAINLALDTISIGKQALVFVNTKRSAEKTAEDIAHKIKTNDRKLILLADKILNVLSRPTKQCQRLANCVRKGIAFHHSGLAAEQRNLIEQAFKENLIKIIACTPTLAAGVDLPSFRTILKDLKRFQSRGMNWIPVLEYLQMAGRSGRPKYDSFGEAVAVAQSPGEKDEIYERYILGEPEELLSKLAVEPVLRKYVLSLIASRFVRDVPSMIEFFEQTFWAFQFKDMAKLESKILKTIKLLEDWKFIVPHREDFVSADEMEKQKLTATPLGKRVAELYLDPLTAHKLIHGLEKAKHMVSHLKPISSIQLVCNTLEMRPLLRVRSKELEKIDEAVIKNHDVLLEEEPSIYEPEHEDFINSVKTSLFMINWIEEEDEESLLEKYDIRPGEIRIKLDLADWLLYSCAELSKILNYNELIKELSKIRTRINYGVKEELMTLVRLKGIGRARARKLFNNGFKDLGDLKRADLSTLSFLIGKGIAESVKEQLGQEVKEVKENKRKGQININDFQSIQPSSRSCN
ncbi:hypothetical protein JXA85_02900 [Candidatus Woesearchaeota archaeon]|nr:hypothetical protein [Candidatus Woesearchaeota archaeon]